MTENMQDITEDIQKMRQSFAEIARQEIEILDKTARTLSDLAVALLENPPNQIHIMRAMLDHPVRPDDCFEPRKALYAGDGEHLPGIDKHLPGIEETYGKLWTARAQVLSGSLTIKVYNAVETWLMTQTLTTPVRRPSMSLALLLSVAAIHNWLWWWHHLDGKHELPRAAHDLHKESPTETLESHLATDVDEFIHKLEKEQCRVGDLIGLHLLTTGLRSLINPPTSGHVQISMADGSVSSGDNVPTPAKTMAAPLAARWQQICRVNPISRLLAIATPQQASLLQTSDVPCHWLDTILEDAGAEPIRQYLASEFGKWLVHAHASRNHVGRILTILNQLDSDIMSSSKDNNIGLQAGWNEFLGQILWATLDHVTSKTQSQIWARWSLEESQQTSLSQWCGRLAFRAELLAQTMPTHCLPEWTWIWFDLGKAALARWLIGRGDTILCLGLWLKGYLEQEASVPPLILGRRAAQQTLEQITAHWLGSTKIVLEGTVLHYEDPNDQKLFSERLRKLEDELRTFSYVDEIAQMHYQDKDTHTKASKSILPEPPDPLEIESTAKIYEYTGTLNTE